LQKNGRSVNQAVNILDPDFVIGVWASASRRQIRTLNPSTYDESYSGDWVQVSRLGMPLTNEVIVPIGNKDLWNALTPYQDLANIATFGKYFYNPELALYMDTSKFAGAVPAFALLRVQSRSLGMFDFRNGANGLFGLKGAAALNGTALDTAIFGNLLLPAPASPRSVDLWPIFNTGVPNLRPYQLATGKNGDPLAAGKPFIHNFLPNGGDMLRLNMAVPATPRNSADFSPLGIVQAAVLGLTDPRFTANTNLQFIPNMDGFPNGRRLEDDVTRIELQAVAGVALAAIGLWYDDFIPGTTMSPVTPQLVNVLSYDTKISKNDTTFRAVFPYVQLPWSGTSKCSGELRNYTQPPILSPTTGVTGLSSPDVFAFNFPNPFQTTTMFKYRVRTKGQIGIRVYDINGKLLQTVVNENMQAGEYQTEWNATGLPVGTYMATITIGNRVAQTIKLTKTAN